MIHSLTRSLINRPVYSIRSQKVRFPSKSLLRSCGGQERVSECLNSSNAKDIAGSVDKKGYPAQDYDLWSRWNHLYVKMRRAFNLWSGTQIYHPGADHLRSAMYSSLQCHKKQVAPWIAFVSSGMLFMLSGHNANIESCNPIQDQPMINTVREFWVYAITPYAFLRFWPI